MVQQLVGFSQIGKRLVNRGLGGSGIGSGCVVSAGRNMPVLFPFDTVETATDYDFVRLAATEQFLLPVESEVLNCQRGSSACSRNKIEFRNYRKFGAESNITFGDAADGKPPQN